METIFYVVGNALQLLVLYAYADKMLERRYSKGITALIWGIVFVLDEVVIYFNKTEVINLIASAMVFTIIFYVGYKKSPKKKVITYIFFGIFMIATEMITMMMFNLLGIDPMENYMMGSAISKILFCVFIRIILIMIHDRKVMDMSLGLWMCVIAMPAGLIAIAILLYQNTEIVQNGAVNIAVLTMLMLINYIAFYMFDDIQQVMVLKNENKLLEQQRSYYLNQSEHTHKLWSSLREFRHNIKNRYIHEKTLLEQKSYKELNDYYNETLGYIESTRMIVRTGNLHIDSMLNYKFAILKELGVEIEYKLEIPDVFSCNYDDIIIILGNLLDNAIEALEEVESGERRFYLRMRYDKPNLLINMTNTYVGERKSDREGNYISTKGNKENHGIGLKSIKRMIQSLKGALDIETEEGVFAVSLYLKLK